MDVLSAEERGAPTFIRSDNGSEFIANAVREWLKRVRIGTAFIDPGAPCENAYIETFNAKLRDERLGREVFFTLAEAEHLATGFRFEYDHRRPHASLEYQTPAEFAVGCAPSCSASLRVRARTRGTRPPTALSWRLDQGTEARHRHEPFLAALHRPAQRSASLLRCSIELALGGSGSTLMSGFHVWNAFWHWYFEPKAFETAGDCRIYRLIGVRSFKRYLPTSGDLVSRWQGITRIQRAHCGLNQALLRYESVTRSHEARHILGLQEVVWVVEPCAG